MILYVMVFLVVAVNGRPEKTIEVVEESEFKDTTNNIAQRIIRDVNESLGKIVEVSSRKGSKLDHVSVPGKTVQLVKNLPMGYKILIDLDVRLKKPEMAERSGFVGNKTESVGVRQLTVGNTTSEAIIEKMTSRGTAQENKSNEYQVYVKNVVTNETLKGGAGERAQSEDLSLTTGGDTKTKNEGDITARYGDFSDVLDILDGDGDNYGEATRGGSNTQGLLGDYDYTDIDRSLSPDKICHLITGLYKFLKTDEMASNTRNSRANPHGTILDWLDRHINLFY